MTADDATYPTTITTMFQFRNVVYEKLASCANSYVTFKQGALMPEPILQRPSLVENTDANVIDSGHRGSEFEVMASDDGLAMLQWCRTHSSD